VFWKIFEFVVRLVYFRCVLTMGSTANLTNRPKTMPRIWGDKIFVDMSKNGGNAIYMFELPEEAM